MGKPRNTQKYPKIPDIPGNTRNTRKYPKEKKIPGNTRSYFSTLLPDPNLTRYPVFCSIPDPTRYWKTLPPGHWLKVIRQPKSDTGQQLLLLRCFFYRGGPLDQPLFQISLRANLFKALNYISSSSCNDGVKPAWCLPTYKKYLQPKTKIWSQKSQSVRYL